MGQWVCGPVSVCASACERECGCAAAGEHIHPLPPTHPHAPTHPPTPGPLLQLPGHRADQLHRRCLHLWRGGCVHATPEAAVRGASGAALRAQCAPAPHHRWRGGGAHAAAPNAAAVEGGGALCGPVCPSPHPHQPSPHPYSSPAPLFPAKHPCSPSHPTPLRLLGFCLYCCCTLALGAALRAAH